MGGKNKKGFSLLEMIVVICIFAFISLSVVSSFASIMGAQNKARKIQKEMEAAGTAMESMAKTIRMSSYLTKNSGNSSIYMYNNSQGKCVRYRFSASNLQVAEFVPLDPASECSTGANYTNYINIISGVSGIFSVVKTDATVDPKVIGKATILMKMGDSSLQTTVSFMDYNGIIQ